MLPGRHESMRSRADEPGNSPLGIGHGVRAFFGGITFIVGTPSIWGYALVPIGMVLFLASAFGILGIWGAARASDALFASYTGSWVHVGAWVLTIILALAAVAVAIVLSICLAQPFSSFALEAIVSARERTLTGRPPPRPSFIMSILRGLSMAVFTVAVALPVFGLLLLVNLFFPPALVVTVPLKFLFCGWLLAWNFLDYPLGIHGLGLQARLRWVARHFDAFCVFGLAWAVVALVPGMLLLLLPMGVAGAAQLVVEAEQSAKPNAPWRLDFAK